MTEYEINNLAYQKVGLIINGLYLLATLLLAALAIFGERIKQSWHRPKLRLTLDEPTLTGHYNTGQKGWYYHVKVINDRKRAPAQNVRVLLCKVMKKGPDGSWLYHKFSGPVQVMWIWPDFLPQYITVGPDERATFCSVLENSEAIDLKLYVVPMNLPPYINSNEPTKIVFKAVSDTAESNELGIEIAWDGKWEPGFIEMKTHMVLRQVDA
jgi:hypothetical protein